MADKREQCEKCTTNCPPNIIQAKINKGRIPFDKCMDFSPIQTNADRIRSMTDEELAEFLDNVFNNIFVGYEFPCENCTERINCDVCFQDWLQSEAE